jgi:hypothetical protein
VNSPTVLSVPSAPVHSPLSQHTQHALTNGVSVCAKAYRHTHSLCGHAGIHARPSALGAARSRCISARNIPDYLRAWSLNGSSADSGATAPRQKQAPALYSRYAAALRVSEGGMYGR